MAVLDSPVLTPRDLKALNHLKEFGVTMLEVKITEFSPVRGKRLAAISLPEQSRVLGVIRNERLVTELDAVFLEEADTLFLITTNESAVRNIFTVFQ